MGASVPYIVTIKASVLLRVRVHAVSGAQAMSEVRDHLSRDPSHRIDSVGEPEMLPPEVTEAEME